MADDRIRAIYASPEYQQHRLRVIAALQLDDQNEQLNDQHEQLPTPRHAGIPRSQSHMVNLLSDDFIAGYMDEGRMSVVRRFFCLFVTFDVVFVSLLWIICVVITGDNIMHALQSQVVHYTIYTSLFDVVITALIRFIFLTLFYGLCHLNHWIVIAFSTTGSCAFLIYKVFMYNWTATPQPVFEVLLVVISFVLAWGEAWFLDCRVIPQERYASRYNAFIQSQAEARTPLLAQFLTSSLARATESVRNYYSPYDSIHNSEDEEDEQDEEFKRMGTECVRKAYALLESNDWKLEKMTQDGDVIRSCTQDKLGKIYRLTGKIHYPARQLLQELYYKIEEIPNWNPTLLESKIIRKIDSHTDISYQATIGGGGGVVKSRDFVNLRCWHLCRDGRVIEGVDLYPANPEMGVLTPVTEDTDEDNDGPDGASDSDDECVLRHSSSTQITKSSSEFKLSSNSVGNSNEQQTKTAFATLSKSLGAQDFQHTGAGASSDPEDVFSDALTEPKETEDSDRASSSRKRRAAKSTEAQKGGNVYVSAAISIEYPGAPVTNKYIRGENNVSCWAMREIENQKGHCIFEWLLCLDLKGFIPRYVLDTAYTTLMQDYMTHLRKYVVELRKEGKVPANNVTTTSRSKVANSSAVTPKAS
ncbi:steroidogenic acute regulatory protein-like [Malaya genurostris]|uniref:steroidogenic acute regulatory protein-like n=1 Tax=Malaya genurostris TaxID=325434 RepID=UPI0026F3C6F2|nr:steroidogenic acute regulatory protein-like [Malaya genurostris]